MNDQDWLPMDADDSSPAVVEPVSPKSTGQRLRDNTRAVIAGSLLVGGVAGAAILGPLTAAAASPTPTTVTTPAGSTDPAASTAPAATADTDTEQPGGHRGPGGGGHVEAVSDTSVVATAIGITEADLKTALAAGQTVAAVASAHNVPLQTVIDALVADGTSELAAQVANGSITQAQADAEKAEILQRATDQANGSFGGGRPKGFVPTSSSLHGDRSHPPIGRRSTSRLPSGRLPHDPGSPPARIRDGRETAESYRPPDRPPHGRVA